MKVQVRRAHVAAHPSWLGTMRRGPKAKGKGLRGRGGAAVEVVDVNETLQLQLASVRPCKHLRNLQGRTRRAACTRDELYDASVSCL